ncbi:MAG: winged helix-turn-helix domain-containing protein [Actinomycetota bacterium]
MTGSQPWAVKVGVLEVDLSSYRAAFRGRELDLNASQLEVLAILLANRSRVCSRLELSQATDLYGARTIDAILTRIRQQVGMDFIKNVHNMGWIIEPEKLN